MIISEIFSSVDGESKRAGELSTFIRTVGCNLRCVYCDSKYTWDRDESSREMTVDDIVEECDAKGIKNITFTGGEPLLQKDADLLIERLSKKGYNVCIETDGAVDFTTRSWFINNYDNVWVCSDYKSIFSGQTNKMLSLDKFSKLRPEDVLKFVVSDTADLDQMLYVVNYLRSNDCDCYIYVSPVFDKIKYEDIIKFMLDNRLQNKIRFQLQLHKFIWDPDKRGV